MENVVYLFMLIASVDIDRVVREMDFQTLQQNIFNVAFCNIDAEVSTTYSANASSPALYHTGVQIPGS